MVRAELLWAAQLWGAAEHIREAIGAPIPAGQRAAYEHAARSTRRRFVQPGKKDTAVRSNKCWQHGQRSGPLDLHWIYHTPYCPSRAVGSARLTTRESKVLRLLSEGLTNPQIAERLVVSLPTVNKYVASIFNKLGVNSHSAATRAAVEQQLI